jgi:hypothetical protein
MITPGGLVFTSAAMDLYLRAFDIETGKELWQYLLPAGGQATPMTYTLQGKQYLVIAAAGTGSWALQRFHFRRLQSDRTQRGFSSRKAALRCPVLFRVEVKML